MCLAYIVNEEDQNPKNIIKNGVGTDEANIKQWTDDIWETYDANDDGKLDPKDITKFIEQTFAKVGIDAKKLHKLDHDVFFMGLDITATGNLCKSEFRNYLNKIGRQEPDQSLQMRLDIP